MGDDVIKERMEITYRDVVKLIHKRVNSLVGNGITYNREQAISDANLAFVNAYYKYEIGKAMFSTHVGYRTTMRIMTEFRKLYKRPRPLTFSELDESGQDQIARKLSVKPEPIEKELPKWTELLSTDGKITVGLILNPTRDILLFMQEKGCDKAKTFRNCVKEYLIGIGWKRGRVARTFTEIRRAIKNE